MWKLQKVSGHCCRSDVLDGWVGVWVGDFPSRLHLASWCDWLKVVS
jgi:hypothetical protein